MCEQTLSERMSFDIVSNKESRNCGLAELKLEDFQDVGISSTQDRECGSFLRVLSLDTCKPTSNNLQNKLKVF